MAIRTWFSASVTASGNVAFLFIINKYKYFCTMENRKIVIRQLNEWDYLADL
jgi:hypothetical protein